MVRIWSFFRLIFVDIFYDFWNPPCHVDYINIICFEFNETEMAIKNGFLVKYFAYANNDLICQWLYFPCFFGGK